MKTHTLSENMSAMYSEFFSELGWIVVLSKDIRVSGNQCFLMQPCSTRDPPLLGESSKHKTRI